MGPHQRGRMADLPVDPSMFSNVTSNITALDISAMPQKQQILFGVACALTAVTTGLSLKTWKAFKDAPKTLSLPALLQAVVITPAVFSLAGLVGVASPLTYSICAVAVGIQLRALLGSWTGAISVVAGSCMHTSAQIVR